MIPQIKQFGYLCLLLFIAACVEEPQVEPVGVVEGLKPVYIEEDVVEDIVSLPPQPIKQLGKIYYKDDFLFVSEISRGIHIINNSDPTQPTKVGFIQVNGSRDIAIKGNILYTDNITDLVAIDISDFNDVKEVKRIKDLYSAEDFQYPDSYEGPFECYDPAKGVVIGWETATLNNPECWR